MEVREMHLYSAKIDEKEVENLFNLIVKARFPLLGFISFSDVLSLNALTLIFRRKQNTIKLYVQDKQCLKHLSALIFPFRLCDASILEPLRGSFFPVPKLFLISGRNHDVLDFVLKEDIEEFSVRITKLFGSYFGVGTMTDTKGRKGIVLISDPQWLFRIDLEKNPSIYVELLEPLPKKMYLSSEYPVFEDTGMSVGVDNFDTMQHSLIVGTSGAGKSKALYVLLRAMEAKHGNNARILVIDPHGEFSKMMPYAKVINFTSNYLEPLDVGKEKSPMLTQLIAQLISSTIGQDNKYSERVLFYAIHLLSSINKLELGNISKLLTDPSTKAEFVSISENAEVKRFFDEEYNDIYIHHFNSAILPILNFIGEYQLYLGKEMKRENLLDVLKSSRVTVVSFDPHFFGRRMISFLAGAIINQMYILAITGNLEDKPTVMVVDEFPRVETRVIRDILAETRKFNLYAYLSCQYLGQLSKDVLDAMVSNVRNIIAFKLNRQDAALLSSIMEIKVEEYFKKSRAQSELEESKKEMFVRLHQRECIVRLFDGTKYLLPMKLRVVDMRKWGFRESGIQYPADHADVASSLTGASQGKGNAAPPTPTATSQLGNDAQSQSAAFERETLPEPMIDHKSITRRGGGGERLPGYLESDQEPKPERDGHNRKDDKDDENADPEDSTGGYAVFVSDDGTTIIKRKRKLKKNELDV